MTLFSRHRRSAATAGAFSFAMGAGALCLTATAISVCAPGYAQAGATTSSVAGVALPKGAARVSDSSLVKGMSNFMAAGAKDFKIPQKSGGQGTAEVYFWDGENYKAGRARFMMTMFKSALTEAGYQITDIDPFVDNIPNIFEEENFGTAALNLAYNDDKPAFFHATNPQTKRTLVGMWLNQASRSRVVFAVAEVGYAALASQTKAPDVTGENVWLVKDFKDASKGLPAPPMPTFPKLAPKPRTVRGVVKDAGGKPLAGAHLVAWASAFGGARTSIEGTTNADGIYEIPLPVGICQIVNADYKDPKNDDSMLLPLHPVDGTRDEFNAATGHVENFVLRTSGASGDGSGNYGASMRVLTWHIPERSIVELSLKPNGPLMDGSTGKTLLFRWNAPKAESLSGETFIAGIPLGRYTLTAKVYDGDDALPLRARKITDDELKAVLPVVFEAEGGGKRASLGKSGTRQFDVTMEP